ncbi:MAG: protein phosphatase 2C domain-containing protein, partial [Bacillota bacterium]|nr:protein phosphatase 2C domain-containing protein [Bacillota bacterium]
MWVVQLDSNKGKVRAVNQDSWVSETISLRGEKILLCGVADGMGGHLSGDVASRIAVTQLARGVESSTEGIGFLETLAQGFKAANQAVYHESLTREDCAGMGTTLTAALLYGDSLFLGHVGDSRAYGFSKHGFTRLTQDHSLVEELVRQGGLSLDDAEKHPQRNMLIKALGIEAEVDVDYAVVNIIDCQCVLFCTDGLTRLVSDAELESVLAVRDRSQVVKQLMDMALDR